VTSVRRLGGGGFPEKGPPWESRPETLQDRAAWRGGFQKKDVGGNEKGVKGCGRRLTVEPEKRKVQKEGIGQKHAFLEVGGKLEQRLHSKGERFRGEAYCPKRKSADGVPSIRTRLSYRGKTGKVHEERTHSKRGFKTEGVTESGGGEGVGGEKKLFVKKKSKRKVLTKRESPEREKKGGIWLKKRRDTAGEEFQGRKEAVKKKKPLPLR